MLASNTGDQTALGNEAGLAGPLGLNGASGHLRYEDLFVLGTLDPGSIEITIF